MYDYYLTVNEASDATGFPVRKWFQWILKGLVSSVPSLKADYINGVSYDVLSHHVHIPVSSLPKYYRNEYLKHRLLKDSLFQADFAGFLDQHGEEQLNKLLEEIELIKRFIAVKQNAETDKTEKAKAFAANNGVHVSTLYRKEKLFMKSDLKKLITPTIDIYHPKDICLLSEDYAKFEWNKPNHLKKCEILKKLKDEAEANGTAICKKCPYNPNSRNNRVIREKYRELDFFCEKVGNGMLYPKSKDPFNRFLSSLGEQETKYSREGPNAWRDEFMHVTKRDRPELVNKVWFGDHHLGDIVLICGYDKSGKPILKRPWITCNHEAASSALIGSIISIHPNSMTIAESFCRSAAFTVDSPFYGLCEVFYCDRGMDYRATILEGRDYDMRQRIDQHYYLNRAFCDNPLLPALNVTVHHALPRSGRSKTIERLFGTVTRKFFQEIPGWVGNRPSNRPFDFEKEEKRLIESGGLWTLEKFARYWFDVVVPAYNNTVPEDETESPIQKYMRLERADTIVPDWNTLTVFMAKKPKHLVHPQGIKYRKELYWHPELAKENVMGNYVSIYDFDQTFCHSISVIHNGKYLCEAEPLVHQQVLEPDRLKLEQHLEEQKAQKRRISRKVTAVKQVLKKAKVKAQRYIEYEPVDDLTEDSENSETVIDDNPVMYCETIDESRDQKEAAKLSVEANEIAKVAQKTREVMEQILDGPKSSSFENYYISQGESVLKHEK